jgi:hypothetical protein
MANLQDVVGALLCLKCQLFVLCKFCFSKNLTYIISYNFFLWSILAKTVPRNGEDEYHMSMQHYVLKIRTYHMEFVPSSIPKLLI